MAQCLSPVYVHREVPTKASMEELNYYFSPVFYIIVLDGSRNMEQKSVKFLDQTVRPIGLKELHLRSARLVLKVSTGRTKLLHLIVIAL